jgi:hypothetical protein
MPLSSAAQLSHHKPHQADERKPAVLCPPGRYEPSRAALTDLCRTFPPLGARTVGAEPLGGAAQRLDDAPPEAKEQNHDAEAVEQFSELTAVDQRVVQERKHHRPDHRTEQGAEPSEGHQHQDPNVNLVECERQSPAAGRQGHLN